MKRAEIAIALVIGALLLPAMPASAMHDGAVAEQPRRQLSIDERVEVYDLTAYSMEGLQQQMATRGPPRGDALTRAELRVDWEPSSTPDGRCGIGPLDVGLQLVVALPRWTQSARASQKLRQHWQRMLNGLRRHEEAHRRDARAAAELLLEKLASVGSRRDCALLKRDVGRIVQREAMRLQVRSDAFDRRTDHGRTEGARL